MNMPYSKAALVAALLLVTVVLCGAAYARRLEYRYLDALAPMMFQQKNQGSAMQRAAFDQPDMVPLYASSELIVAQPYQHQYLASAMFQQAPTGFRVFPVGKDNTTCLTILEKLAALGPSLRGKKVVISLSPSAFYNHAMVSPFSYAGNFSHLHASELAFSTDLSFDLKQAAARRMLEYPKTLEHDPLLRFALEKLADGSLVSQALYYAALPLGKLQTLVLRLQDHWEMVAFIWQHDHLKPNVPRRKQPIDWPATLNRAEMVFRQHNDNNPFGFDNQLWQQKISAWAARSQNTRPDAKFLADLQRGKEWTDLNLLLRELNEMGAQPLILAMPMPGQYYDYLGVTPEARKAYYAKLRAAVQPFGVPLRDFEDHDEDKDFFIDFSSHLSAVGWVYYDQAIDAFYHGTLR
jgi:D-alanine transfer protein